jgi:hypothetical protein
MPRSPKKPANMADRVRKNMDMDAVKLSAVQKVPGAATETDTVDMALDYVLFQAEVMGALDRLAAVGGLDDIYAAAERPPRRRVAER